jgi:PilZ domain
MWALQFGVLTAANAALGRGHFRPFLTEFFDLMKMFAFISAGPTLLSSRPLRFKVTPKGEPGARALHPLLIPFCLLLGLYAVSDAIGLARLAGVWFHTHNPAAMLGAVIWGIGIVGMLAAVTVYGYRHVNRRRVYRVPVQLPAIVSTAEGEMPAIVCDLTLLGLACTTDVPLILGERVAITISDTGLTLSGAVRMARPDGSGASVAGVALTLDDEGRARLAALISAALHTPATRAFPVTPPLPAATRPAA